MNDTRDDQCAAVEGAGIDNQPVESWQKNVIILLPKLAKPVTQLQGPTRGIRLQSTLARWCC